MRANGRHAGTQRQRDDRREILRACAPSGLDILEVLAKPAGGLARGEPVRELGLSASQIYRMLERLVARGYVSRLPGRPLRPVDEDVPAGDGAPAASREMDRFARDMNQSCHLVMPQNGSGIVLAQASPVANWQFRARVGAAMDLLSTGSGLTLLAFQKPERLVETPGFSAPAGVEDRLAQLGPELARIRAAGCRARPSSQLAGLTDLSVPVIGPAGDAVAAITCADPEHPGDARAAQREATLERLRGLGDTLSLGAATD